MTDVVYAWYMFIILEAVFISLITLLTNNLRFLTYSVVGGAVGLVFDHSAILLGFYKYSLQFDPAIIGLVPFTVSAGEGMGIAAMIFTFEALTAKIKIKF